MELLGHHRRQRYNGLFSSLRTRWSRTSTLPLAGKTGPVEDDDDDDDVDVPAMDAVVVTNASATNNKESRGRECQERRCSSRSVATTSTMTQFTSFRSTAETTTVSLLPSGQHVELPNDANLDANPPKRMTTWEPNTKYPNLGFLKLVDEFDTMDDALVVLAYQYSDKRIFYFCYNNNNNNNSADQYDMSVLTELLSDPLLVEALETLFWPIGLQSAPPNTDMEDQATTAAATPVSLFMPSIGFCDEFGHILTTLSLFDLTRQSLLLAIRESYNNNQTQLPQYVRLLLSEANSQPRHLTVLLRNVAEAQVILGLLDGVLHSQPKRWTVPRNKEDWLGVSAITITYDSRRLSFSQVCRVLLSKLSMGSLVQIVCSSHDEMLAARIETSRCHHDPHVIIILQTVQQQQQHEAYSLSSSYITNDQHHHHQEQVRYHQQYRTLSSAETYTHVRRTILRYAPMTNLQALLINAIICQSQFHEAIHLLSPRQVDIVRQSRNQISCVSNNILFDIVPLTKAWNIACNSCIVEKDTLLENEKKEDKAQEIYQLLLRSS